MKIEKISENQIRCTLTSADLTERHLKMSELAFGTDQAKKFFQDMMDQALYELGFDVDGAPLMIEAIPMSSDSLVLIITKGDGKSEGDSLLSKLAQHANRNAQENMQGSLKDPSAPPQVKSGIPLSVTLSQLPEPLDAPASEREIGAAIFAFQTMDSVIKAAKILKGVFTGHNTLYKDTETGDFFLVLISNAADATPFSNICNILSEYGVQNLSSGTSLAYLEEHFKLVINGVALQKLSEL